MSAKVLIFDIGGTVFDWNSAITDTLQRLAPIDLMSGEDRRKFALACRSGFLFTSGAVVRGEEPWMTADEILARVVDDVSSEAGLAWVDTQARFELAMSWRRMPAWPSAREAIASLRHKYIVAPLTILSWSMAVGSSRLNGINWDSILSCDILGIYKPDPRCYSRAAEIVGCAPDDMLMVASHPSDLRAAMACGYRSAYVVPSLEDPGDDYVDTGFTSEFDYVVRDFEDLATRLL